MRIALIISFMLFLWTNLNAAYLYVDQGDHESGVTWDDTDGHSYTSSAGGFPGAGTGYNTIQAAVDAVSAGDTIYMRGGTYTGKQNSGSDYYMVLIAEATVGTDGNWITLASYPGEWAILDGENDGTESIGIAYGYTGQNWNHDWNTAYWRFERFEVKGFRHGFWTNGGPQEYRYLYIHDNNSATDNFVCGIFIMGARYVTIEYCYLSENHQRTAANRLVEGGDANNGNIIFDGDYQDDLYLPTGGAFVAGNATHHNEVRYNYLFGSPQGIRQKGDQKIGGYNDRNPNDMTYAEYGDKIHHNIVLDTRYLRTPDLSQATGPCILFGQDFAQIYNNITDWAIRLSKTDGNPTMYNQVAYNNTLIGTTSNIVSRICWNGSYSEYYEVPHPHVYMFNNLSSGSTSTTNNGIWVSHDNETPTGLDRSDIVVERNLFNNSTPTDLARIGTSGTSGSGCDDYTQSISTFNSCSNTWRGIETVVNWDVDGSLFLGESGADQYTTDGAFVVSGATTIANGGYNAAHPYLDGVTIPDYIGATNPDDYSWVAGVLAMDADYFKDQTGGSDPTWIEGSDPESPSTPTITGGFGGSLQ